MDNRQMVADAVAGVTHVLHLATTKETPATIFDVAIKGLFWLLEACRASPTFCRLVVVGGDAAHRSLRLSARHPSDGGTTAHGLSRGVRTIEGARGGDARADADPVRLRLLLPTCALDHGEGRLRYQLSFGEDVFGAPRWRDLVGAEQADRYAAEGAVPVMLGQNGRPVKRNFVHVEDLVDAIIAALDQPAARQQTFNVSMDKPVITASWANT